MGEPEPVDPLLPEEDVHDLYEHAPCGYLSTLPEGRIVKVNQTFLEWTGYSRNKLLEGRRFQDLLTLPGRIFHDTHYGPLLTMQGHVRELAFEIICEGGRLLPVLLNATVRKNEEGTPQVIRISVLDARSRRMYERELLLAKRKAQEAEAALKALNDNLEQQVAARTAEKNRLWRTAQDILLVGTFDGRITSCNPALAEVLGWSESELTVRRFPELARGEDQPSALSSLQELARGKSVRQLRLGHRDKEDKLRWISWNIVPEQDVLYYVGRDVTEEVRQAEALREAEDALRQAQKTEALGQLTGGLAHDFNNLLAGIVGNLQIMRLRLQRREYDALGRYLEAAESVAERASGLTHRLLAFARRQALAPEVLDGNELIESLQDMLRQTLGPNTDLQLQLAPELPPILADRNQLESALLNLVINARDAMPAGGRVTVCTSVDHSGGPPLESATAEQAEALKKAEHICISVRDTGTGMGPDVIKRAFDPFFTTKPAGQGTGLGLSMIFGFVKQSNGQVRIASEPGMGTTVSMYFPPADDVQDAVQPGAAAGLQAALPAASTWRVLVVEDEAALRSLLTETLQETGYSVDQAENASEALALLRDKGPFDLLISDIGLPGGMSGDQLAELARSTFHGLKVLLITGYGDQPQLQERLSNLNMDVLNKPFRFPALLEKAKQLLES